MPIDANDNYLKYTPYEIHSIIENFNSNVPSEQYIQFLKTVELATTIIMVVLDNMIKSNKSNKSNKEFLKNVEHFITAFNYRQNSEYLYFDKEYFINPYLNKFDKEHLIKFIIVKINDIEYHIRYK